MIWRSVGEGCQTLRFWRSSTSRKVTDSFIGDTTRTIRHAANTHMIPEDDRIRDKIAKLRKGSLVKMIGYLVEATNPRSATPWRSSLTREDSGDGACEIFYVRSLQELK